MFFLEFFRKDRIKREAYSAYKNKKISNNTRPKIKTSMKKWGKNNNRNSCKSDDQSYNFLPRDFFFQHEVGQNSDDHRNSCIDHLRNGCRCKSYAKCKHDYINSCKCRDSKRISEVFIDLRFFP